MGRPDATDDMPGCGDGGCIIARPLGQHTNSGCRCLRGIDDRRARRDIQRTIDGLRAELAKAVDRVRQVDDMLARINSSVAEECESLRRENDVMRARVKDIEREPDRIWRENQANTGALRSRAERAEAECERLRAQYETALDEARRFDGMWCESQAECERLRVELADARKRIAGPEGNL